MHSHITSKIVKSMEWPVKLDDIVGIPTLEGTFRIPRQIVTLARQIVNIDDDPFKKMLYLNRWIINNVSYVENSREILSEKFGYSIASNPITSLKYKIGVCQDMSYALVALGLSVGVDVRLVNVSVDVEGKNVSHMCVISENTFFDPAYKGYGLQHQEFSINSLRDTIEEIETSMAYPFINAFNESFENGNNETALKYIDMCLYLCPTCNTFLYNKSSVLNNLGVDSISRGDIESARIFFTESLDFWDNKNAQYNLNLIDDNMNHSLIKIRR